VTQAPPVVLPQVLRKIIEKIVPVRAREVAPDELLGLLVDLNQEPFDLRTDPGKDARHERSVDVDLRGGGHGDG
jgi:hypothetical protein